MSNLLHLVEPHAANLEAAADSMVLDGIGGDPNNGHAVILRRMAGDMRAEAARGHLAGNFHAAAAQQQSFAASNVLSACAAVGVPVPAEKRWASIEKLDAALDTAFKNSFNPNAPQDRIELKASIFAAGLVQEPEKPIDPVRVKNTIRLLNKHGIEFSRTHMFSVADINKAMAEKNMSPEDRASLKTHLLASGMLDPDDGNVPHVTPPAVIASVMKSGHVVLQRLGLDEPARGKKLNLGVVNAAAAKLNLPTDQAIAAKAILARAGYLD